MGDDEILMNATLSQLMDFMFLKIGRVRVDITFGQSLNTLYMGRLGHIDFFSVVICKYKGKTSELMIELKHTPSPFARLQSSGNKNIGNVAQVQIYAILRL